MRTKHMTPDKQWQFHLISNTHWDREWYMSFESFRLRLVRLFDRLLAVMARDEAFRSFLLDVQFSASDVCCPVVMSSGLIDPVSPPVSVFAVYKRLGTAKKTMVPLDGLGHDWSAEFDRQAWHWLDGVLGTASGAVKKINKRETTHEKY